MNNNILNLYRQNNFHKILSVVWAVMVLLNFHSCSTLAKEYYSNKRNKTAISDRENSSSTKKPAIAPVLVGSFGIVAVASGVLYYIFHDSDGDDAIMQQNSPTDESDLKDNSMENLAPFETYHMPFSEEYWPEILDNEIDKSSENETAKIDISEKLIDTLLAIDKDVLTRIHFIQGDVANPQKPVGAVVNAANNQLKSGSGVCGAIYGQAGARLNAEIKSLKSKGTVPEKIDNGSAVITHSHNIKNADAIIHTPGPDLRGIMNQPIHPYCELASAYGSSIAIAHENGLKSVAFPSISTGIFEFPAVTATIIAVHTVVKALKEYPEMEVYFVVWPGAKNFDKVMEKLNKNYE